MSTRRCPAEQAFRMRVSISATGSVRLIPSFPLPAGLAHARDFSPQGELTETDAAETELPQYRARPPAPLAAADGANLELGRALGTLDPGGLRHVTLPFAGSPRGMATPARGAAPSPGRRGRWTSRWLCPSRGSSRPCRNRSPGRSSAP